jgi:hypothetical protein
MAIFKKINTLFSAFGIDFYRFFIAVTNLPFYLNGLLRYNRLNKSNSFKISFNNLRPILNERNVQAGYLSMHYFHQDIWAAKKIFNQKPSKHFDIGSRIDGFISHLLVFMPVNVLDIRPLSDQIENLNFTQCDATNLEGIESNSIESLSSLHAIEHFGLGRYGDDIDPDGYKKVLKAMQRVLKKDGYLYIGVPTGIERVEYNSQRVFNPSTIISELNDLELVSFSLVNDDGTLTENLSIELFKPTHLSCGLFEFKKTRF